MKPEHEQKLDELISEFALYKTPEGSFIASVLCALQSSIIIDDMEDFSVWVSFYIRQMMYQVLTEEKRM